MQYFKVAIDRNKAQSIYVTRRHGSITKSPIMDVLLYSSFILISNVYIGHKIIAYQNIFQ